MRKAVCLKPFAYAHDHVNSRLLVAGEEFECQDDVLAGLMAEGLADHVKASATPAQRKADERDAAEIAARQAAEREEAMKAEAARKAAVEIPANWSELGPEAISDLAARIAGPDLFDESMVQSVIEAEIARRAEA